MLKLFIGIIVIACIFSVYSVSAEAATSKRAKIVNFVGKTCDDAANVLWRNKGAVTLGTVLVTAAANPEPFIEGTTTIIGGGSQTVFVSCIGTILFYLLLAVLVIAGTRFFLHRIRLWRVLPLLILGLMFGSGVAEAGVIPIAECGVIKPPWWNIFDLIILIFAIFL